MVLRFVKDYKNIDCLPVELIVEIFSCLDVSDLINVSSVSRSLRSILADHNLNPWRTPLLRLLDTQTFPNEIENISDHNLIFPRANLVIILSRSDPRFLEYKCVIPHLSESDWEAAFEARYLPSWRRWKKKNMRWREAFLR